MMDTPNRPRSDWVYQFAAALIFLGTLALVNAGIRVGMNDDWSYILTVRDFAATGHFRYNGWSAPLIGFQAYWGALFVKLFGFSFLAVRASSWILTLVSVPVLWRLLRGVGLSQTLAFFGLLAFLLSPLNLPNLATFMTDMPAFMLFAAALLSAMEAWNSTNDRVAMRWVCCCTVFGMLSGSVRQIYWLCGICFLIVLAFTRLRSTRGRILIAACLTTSLGFAVICSQWLAAQPYVPADTTMQAIKSLPPGQLIHILTSESVRAFVAVALLCVPFSMLFIRAEIRRASIWAHLLILPLAIAIAFIYSRPLPWLGNTITKYGVLLPGSVSVGDRPEVLPAALVVALAAIGLMTAGYAFCGLMREFRGGISAQTGLGRFTALTMPFVTSYAIVLAVRAMAFGLFDRYLIPLIFIVSTLMLGVYARYSQKIGGSGWTAAAVFALYSLATTHDYFAEAQAKLSATEGMLRDGIPRDSILSGFEYDLWTQAELTGHINNKLVKYPAEGYQQREDCDGEDDVLVWWRVMAPDLKQRYIVSISPLTDLQPTKFPPVRYWRWLPFADSHVYVQQVNASGPPLTCALGSAQ